jgi:hypothetical protein
MTPYFKSLLYAAGIVAVGFVLGTALFGCTTLPRAPAAQTDIGIDKISSAQSWDQENLKRNDRGCPTAIYVAPTGDLVQCQLIEDARPAVDGDKVQFFKTQDEAAIYVVGKIYEKSHYYEYGGVILKAPLGYAVSLPTTQHHGMDVSFDEDPESYEFPIVASYHVHPCLKNAFPGVFSPQDLAGSRATHTPGYVLDECTGAVHYWAPGDGYLTGDEALKMGVTPIMLMMGVQLSAGKVVGKIVVDGVVIN